MCRVRRPARVAPAEAESGKKAARPELAKALVGGAKIMTEAEIDVGDRFAIALVPTHPRRQQCQVVWRRGTTFGVKFVARQPCCV